MQKENINNTSSSSNLSKNTNNNKNYYHLFIIFQKLKTNIFFSKTLNTVSPIYLINNKWLLSLCLFISHSINYSTNYLVDNSIINYTKTNNLMLNNIIYWLSFSSHFNKKKIIFLIWNKFNSFSSLSSIFINNNWLERESSEMYKIVITNKKDSRKLLLDYIKNEYPLMKLNPIFGLDDIFYNLFCGAVYSSNDTIKLNNEVEL